MAFPGTYNIEYYKGDTYEFRIYPKDSSGAPFSLYGYGAERFTVAPTRGNTNTANNIECYAKIDNDNILCVIRPSDGEKFLSENSPYYYDVEIENVNGEYTKLYTLVTGSISITDQVTPKKDKPDSPESVSVTAGSVTSDSFTITWEPPASGEPYTGYIVGISLTQDIADAETHLIIDPSITTYTFTNLVAEEVYYVGVITTNSAGNSDPTFYQGFVTTLADPVS
jgi:hypothetical protein